MIEHASLVETSMSALDTFSRCQRKYMYQEVRGWLPRTTSKPMEMGIAFHAAIAAGNRAVRDMENTPYQSDRLLNFIEAARLEIQNVKYDRDGRELGLTPEDRELLTDMVDYWFEFVGEHDLIKTESILYVEEPLYVQVGRYLIRCTTDAVKVYRGSGGEPVVVDYKTGDPKEVMAWIALDLQRSTYCIAARGRWGNVRTFRHMFQRREVPPGYGHRPAKTKSGAVSRASTDPADYVGVIDTTVTDQQFDAYTRELVDIVSGIDHCIATDTWLRTRIKIGPMACATSCAYFATCCADRDGNAPMLDSIAQETYLVKGSDEWKSLTTNKG